MAMKDGAKIDIEDSLTPPFQCNPKPREPFEHLWKDARGLEDEIEVLKWMARRKELEWDCAKQMIVKKKVDIKAVKRKINMVKTLNDFGPQLNVDSDDEDTPSEDYDDDTSSDDDERMEDMPHRPNDTIGQLPLFVRQPFLKKDSSKKADLGIQPDYVTKPTQFSHGHLCLFCKEKQPLFLCSICHNSWYCSQECQEKDWDNHEKDCDEDSIKSEYCDESPPDLIRFPQPKALFKVVLGPEIEQKDLKQTHNCLRCQRNMPYFLCSICRNFWYCSHKCHEVHWELHKPFCQPHYAWK